MKRSTAKAISWAGRDGHMLLPLSYGQRLGVGTHFRFGGERYWRRHPAHHGRATALSFVECTASSHFQLKHREVNDAIINLSTRKPGPGDTLKLRSMLMKIAERLVLRLERCLKSARLSNGTYCQYKSDRLPITRFCLRYDPHWHVAAPRFRTGYRLRQD